MVKESNTNKLFDLRTFVGESVSAYLSTSSVSSRMLDSVDVTAPKPKHVQVQLVFSTILVNKKFIRELSDSVNTTVSNYSRNGLELRMVSSKLSKEFVEISKIPAIEKQSWVGEGNIVEPVKGFNGFTLLFKLLYRRN